jgi:hypothetical protein
MRALKILILGLALFALAACETSSLPGLAARRGRCDRDDRLVGTWATKISMSQLGPGFERVTYNCDCTYQASSSILLLIIPIRATETGWFNASNGELVTVGGRFSNRTEARYHFEGKTLVVQQGAQVEKFPHVRSQSCKNKPLPPAGSELPR